jgi:general nucleoside transport system permease protein
MRDFFGKVGHFFLTVFRKIGDFCHWLNGKRGWRSFLSAAICVGIGLFCGFILMLCIDPANSLKGLWILLSQGFSNTDSFGRVIYQATPMMLSGVAIAFAFKLGLFNIGLTGQVTIGAFVGVMLGLSGCNWAVCMLVAMLSGAAIGLLTGYLKARFNVNEVLSGIMLNWIIYYMIGIIGTLWIPSSYKDKITPSQLFSLQGDARMPSLGISSMPGISVGLIIAILIVVLIQIVLNRTTFGFEMKLSGSNKFAAQYAGINQTSKIVLALTISGAVAGICGFMLYANPTNPIEFKWDSGSDSLLADGFTGISVSLIAQNSPLGCIFSAILLTAIDASQTELKALSNSYNIHYTELIKSIIIYVASFSSFFGMLIQKQHARHEDLRAKMSLSPRDEDAKKAGEEKASV